MAIQDFSKTKALNNIPSKKLDEVIASINVSDDTDLNKNKKVNIVNRYYDSNIPIEYWKFKMDKDFSGDPRLLEKYNQYTLDIKNTYFNGKSLCVAGTHGGGKTTVLSCVLKLATLKGYSCLYTTMVDIVSALTQSDSDEKSAAKRELTMVDFLFIDELDYRFFNSDNAKDLYGRTFETILRARLQNKLPTLLATNSPNVKENFISLFKDSLGSLLNRVEMFSVMPGEDFRKKMVEK